ncbi:MAG TPA: LuxR family transcriptional regulator [Jatrophihabitantaceae bacterium]|jgi:DNA-binding CsgD family transcriptional regulator|nr:LuxR family transcriptional regulator [Jatrophihabitantaceae bacterium]
MWQRRHGMDGIRRRWQALSMIGTVVGRDAVLDHSWRALAGQRRVLLEGPAGIGKTALLDALLAHAAVNGMLVLRCAPAETEAALPLVALADLLAPLTDESTVLPDPQRRAMQAALLLDHADSTVDERALASATRTLLDAAAERSVAGVLVAIDDAPWLDPPSERALRFALRRTVGQVRVMVSRRTTDTEDDRLPLGLESAADVERVSLAPLGVGPLHHLLRQRFDVSLSRPLVVRLAHESGGNPLLAIELTRSMLRLPHLPGPGDDLPVPASMQDLVGASLSALPTGAVRAVRLIALMSSPRVADLGAADITTATIDTIEEAGLVVVDGDRVRFVHPAHGAAVRASIPAGARRSMDAHLAEVSTDPDERARHLARSASAPDTAAAAELGAAAARAHARGAPEVAADLYQRASKLTDEEADSISLRLKAVQCLYDCGNYALAATNADTLASTLTGERLAEVLLLRAAIAFSADDLPLATSIAMRALAAAPEGSRLAGRVHAHVAVFVDAPAEGRLHAEAALEMLGGPDAVETDASDAGGLLGSDRALVASVLMLLFLNEIRTGLPARAELLDRALELEAGEPLWLAGTIPPIWWKGIDQQDRARVRLLTMLDAAAASGDEPFQHELIQHLVETETLAANYATAQDWIARALDLAEQLGAGLSAERWLAGMLAAHRGDLDATRTAASALMHEADRLGDSWLRRIGLQLCAFSALAAGDAATAARYYAELAAAMAETGLVESLAARIEPDWIEACVGAGDLATAAQVLARLEQRHARLPRPWTRLGLLRARVLIESAQGRDTERLIAELDDAIAGLDPGVLRFERARATLISGLAHRRARRKKAARDALLAAADAFAAIGAQGFAARARAEAERTGTRATTQLTSSELRVAELAVRGGTNREIAEALFISPKTVEANLARIYRKLDIGRRAELRAALSAVTSAHTEAQR